MCHSQRPAFPCGDGEEREESPEDVVVVKLILLPLSELSRHIVSVIIQELTSGTEQNTREDETSCGCCQNNNTVLLHVCVPAVFLQALGLVGAVEKLALEELHGDDGKDEHEEDVDDEDVEHVLQRVHHAVEHGLQTVDTQSAVLSTLLLIKLIQMIQLWFRVENFYRKPS